jgi:hypothetical protein
MFLHKEVAKARAADSTYPGRILHSTCDEGGSISGLTIKTPCNFLRREKNRVLVVPRARRDAARFSLSLACYRRTIFKKRNYYFKKKIL